MPGWLMYAGGIALLLPMAVAHGADLPRAYIQNEDSHPHQVAPGNSARFAIEAAPDGARMDVKCTLEGDNGAPLAAVTLHSRGLADLQWPYPAHTIRIDHRIDFDITAQTRSAADGPAYFEFVNGDATRLLWHQCYNN